MMFKGTDRFGKGEIDLIASDVVWTAELAEKRWVEDVTRRFYADFERCARERGAPVLLCEVNLVPPNEGSLRFHARQGFEPVGTLDTTGGKTVSLLARELAPA